MCKILTNCKGFDCVGELRQSTVKVKPNSLCRQRYPAVGRKGYNNLIEKIVAVKVLYVKTEKNKGSLTVRVGCGARGRCWLAGDGDGVSSFPLWAMISSVRAGGM